MNTVLELKRLKYEHEAIRRHAESMEQLVDSLSGGMQTTLERAKLLKDKMWNLEWALRYLAKGVEEHITRDEDFVLPRAGDAEELRRQHSEIQQEIHRAIATIGDVDPGSLDSAEQGQYCSAVQEACRRVTGLIVKHSSEEDEIIELLLDVAEPGK